MDGYRILFFIYRTWTIFQGRKKYFNPINKVLASGSPLWTVGLGYTTLPYISKCYMTDQNKIYMPYEW